MADYVTFTIIVNEVEYHCIATVLSLGYSHRIQINIQEATLFFEPDEEEYYRLVKMPWQAEKDILKFDAQMIEQIVAVLNKMNE